MFGGAAAFLAAQAPAAAGQNQQAAQKAPAQTPAAQNGPVKNGPPIPQGTGGPGGTSQVERMQKFLAIGAPPDPAAVARGKNLFVATCGFCHGAMQRGRERARIWSARCWFSMTKTATRSDRSFTTGAPARACRLSLDPGGADFRYCGFSEEPVPSCCESRKLRNPKYRHGRSEGGRSVFQRAG